MINLVEPAQAVPVPQVVVVPPGPEAGADSPADPRTRKTARIKPAATVLSFLNLVDVGNPVIASIRNLGNKGKVYLDTNIQLELGLLACQSKSSSPLEGAGESRDKE